MTITTIELLRQEYAAMTEAQQQELHRKCTQRQVEILELALQGVSAYRIAQHREETAKNIRFALDGIRKRIEKATGKRQEAKAKGRGKAADKCERISPEVWARIRAAGVPV